MQDITFPDWMTDGDKHANLMRRKMDDARNKANFLHAFLDVIAMDPTLTPDQIDVAIDDASSLLRMLRSAKDHADMA